MAASAPPALQVRILGTFALAFDGHDIAMRAWGARNAYGIVKLLALAPGHRLAIDQLLDTLWPEQDPDAARRACYQALYLARKAIDRHNLGLLPLRRQIATLEAPGGVLVDLDAFDAASARAQRTRDLADHEAALALYGGTLLPDDRYAEWTILPRDAAQQRHAASLAACARGYAASGDDERAARTWHRLLAVEPANEEAHLALMRLAARAGRRTQALAQFRQLRAALRRELDASPSASSERLYTAILSGQAQPLAAPAPTGPDLPVPLTALYGRDDAREAVLAALRTARLVTLIGSGGVGKTRLALAVAHHVAGRPDGARWVDLAPLADAGLVAGTVAEALGVPEQAGVPLSATLIAVLGDRAPLLVLDNCEHLVDACARLAVTLLTGCPTLRILATSRVALRVAGELVWRVPALPVPGELPPEATPDQVAALVANPAAQLFLARARLGRPGFAVTSGEAAALARICRRLDGVPLALELAAARLALLSMAQLDERLVDALRLLADGPRTALPRHRTLRATLDWSYRLLGDAEQALLARLATFAGGWTLDAAEAIDGPGGATLEGLASLVEHSLVHTDVPTGETGEARYRLLETVRQFAWERLAAGGATAAARERHAAYYQALAAEAAPHLDGPHRAIWLSRLEREIDNLRAALAWRAAHGEAARGLALAVHLGYLWLTADRLREGLAWLTTAFATGTERVPARLRGQALTRAGVLALQLGDRVAAKGYLDASVALLRPGEAPLDLAHAVNALATALQFLGEIARARALLLEARELYATAGHAPGEVIVLNNLGALARAEGDLPTALEHVAAALERYRRTGLTLNLPRLLRHTGELQLLLERLDDGVATLGEALVASRASADWLELRAIVIAVALLHARRAAPLAAAPLFGAAATLQATLGVVPDKEQEGAIALAEATTRAALGEAAYAAARARGAAWSPAEVSDQALAALATCPEA